MYSSLIKLLKKIMDDQHCLTSSLFYSLGILTLVPSHFFLTANSYWMYKFRDPNNPNTTTGDDRTELQTQFTSDFSIISNVTNVIVLAIMINFGKKITVKNRITGSLLSIFLILGVTTIFIDINTDSWQTGFFVITMITATILTTSSTIFMVTLFELSSKFPPSYMASILSGQSICGISAALIQIISLAIGAGATTNALIYFLVGMTFVMITLISFLTIARQRHFKQLLNNQSMIETEIKKPTWKMVKGVICKIKFLVIAMITVLGCSVSMQPAVTSLIVSQESGKGNQWNDVFFVPVCTFLLYNVFDFAGRETSMKIRKPSSTIIILIIGIFRLIFVPLLMLCNIQSRHHLPVIFNEDYIYIIFIIIFAFSNGYLVNLCIILIPKVAEPEEKSVAFLLILVCMIVSLGACSFLSIALLKAL